MPKREIISEEEFEKIRLKELGPLSVYWELRTLLYLGIVLLTTAVGILIYKNIDSIGHDAIVITVAVLCIISFVYCIKHSSGFSYRKVQSPHIWFDYILLSGCLLLLTLTGYLQLQYNLFGERWALALFIPMVVLFVSAYYFDHLGVLSLAITNFAAWAGISITPLRILRDNDFNDTKIIYSGLVVGITLVTISFIVQAKDIKAHFAVTYKNFGAHILFISLLALMFHFHNTYLLWFMVLTGVSFLFYRNALKEHSFYFLVIAILYAYIGLSYVVIKLFLQWDFDMTFIYLSIIYFIGSGIALIRLFIHYNKTIKKNAGLPRN